MDGWAPRAALALTLVVALVIGLVWLFQRRLIYLPDRTPVPDPPLPGARTVELTTADGLRLAAWFVPAAEPRRGVSVLVAGGNAGNRAHRAPLARALAARGLSVLLMDYRGYGGNPGTPTEAGLALDVRAARDYLARSGEPIVYFGESLGAAVVTELAVEHPPAGLLLRSPFTDLAAAGQVNYPFLPVGLLLWDRFPVAERLTEVRVPTTVVYGTADTTVPPEQSRAVAQAAGGPVRTVEIPGAGHNDPVFLTGEELIDAVVKLAER